MRKTGYLIANDSGEFLVAFRRGQDVDLLAWTPHPGLAVVFRLKQARRLVAELSERRLWIVELWESQTHYGVCGISGGEVPAWLRQSPAGVVTTNGGGSS